MLRHTVTTRSPETPAHCLPGASPVRRHAADVYRFLADVRRLPALLPLLLLSLHPPLMGISACQSSDNDGDGWTSSQGDCDDTDPQTYPDAPEVCDDVDNDCDGAIDGGIEQPWYLDQDGDGYGTSGGEVSDCAQPSGYAAEVGDCDDGDPTVSPGTPEACDGQDDNCDGEIDNPGGGWYLDQDGDGFGGLETGCTGQGAALSIRGDCDDADPAAHPGADDPAGDGLDQDCGGSEGPEPHVGLSAGSSPSIQAAIDAAASGATVWVGPGVWLEHDINPRGKAIQLKSTAFADATRIDARGAGRVMVFDSGEGPDTGVDGFTLTGGYLYQADGAGVRVEGSSPILTGCTIIGNRAEAGTTPELVYGNTAVPARGGGLFVVAGAPTLLGCTLSGNAADQGGGAALDQSDATFDATTISGNTAWFGAGLSLEAADPVLTDCDISNNAGTVGDGSVGELGVLAGGGLYLDASSPTLTGCRIAGNTLQASVDLGNAGTWVCDENACGDDECCCIGFGATIDLWVWGGGMYSKDSSPTLSACTLEENAIETAGNTEGACTQNPGQLSVRPYGGGMFLDNSTPTLTDDVFAGNSAVNSATGYVEGTALGGGLYLAYSAPPLLRLTFRENSATWGGGLYATDSSPAVGNSLFIGNSSARGGGLYLQSSYAATDQCILAQNSASEAGGGVYVVSGEPEISSSILAYNTGYNLYAFNGSPVVVAWSDLYASSGQPNHNLTVLDASNLEVDPALEALSLDGDLANDDYHLALGSPLIDAGDPASLDADGSRSDIGLYGGPDGDGFDRDGDGWFDYFWPGTIDDAPAGLDPADYDADDGDAGRH